MKTTNAIWIVLIMLSSGLASCSSFGLVPGKAYDGPKRQKKETALVYAGEEKGDGWESEGFEDEPIIEFVDGNRFGHLTFSVRVLPGRHVFIVSNRYVTGKNSTPVVNINSIGVKTKTYYVTRMWKVQFDATAGSKYCIREMSRGKPPKVYLHDATSGNIEEVEALTAVVSFNKKEQKWLVTKAVLEEN
jgi:hypothetical protein